MSKKAIANATLLFTAFIWGMAFVVQSVAMDAIGPFTFNGARMALAGVTLTPIALMRARRAKRGLSAPAASGRMLWVGGILCGVILFAASTLQQFGIVDSSAGKAGFITALYIVLVPISGLFFGKRVRKAVWAAVALCATGLYLLCVGETMSLTRGDALLMLCAVFFTAHILVIDHFAPRVDCVQMSCIQFWVSGALGVVCSLCFENPDVNALMRGWLLVFYAGVISGALGYALQMVGQKNADPTVASLIMSLESVFAVLGGWLLQGDRLLPREYAGCAVMMLGIVLAQLPQRALIVKK